MSVLQGMYFDGLTARGLAVAVSCESGHLLLRGDGLDHSIPLAEVELSPRLGRSRRQLGLPAGAVCEVDDHALLDTWFAEARHRRWNLLARLEAHWGAIAAALLAIVILAAVAGIYGVPWAARQIAFAIPQTWVEKIGSGALAAMDDVLGTESRLPPARQNALRAQFEMLAQAAQVGGRFEFRSWPLIGANALALPDGAIVVTDRLVELAEDDRELLAVVAHELGHESERHSLQQLLAGSGFAALIFALTGDVSGVANIVVAAPTVFMHLHYTRGFERDADRFGFTLLCRQHIDPVWFASIIRKLEAEHRRENAEESSAWLSSHPASEERARSAEHFCRINSIGG